MKRLIELVGEGNLPAEYVKRLRSAVPAVVAALILGLKEPVWAVSIPCSTAWASRVR